MKKTLLSSTGALALTLMLGAPAFASDNEAEAGDNQIAVQDTLNDNGNNRDNDHSVNVDDSLNNNDVNSNNDSSLNVDADLENIGNDYSKEFEYEVENEYEDNSQRVDADLDNIGNDYSDNSTSIEDVAVLVSTQSLVGVAAQSMAGGWLVKMDDIETGDVDFDFGDAAGSVTSSANTGLSSNAQAATAILANGDFQID